MATVANTTFANVTVADRVRGFIADFKAAQALRAEYTATYNELDSLTDRDLADLGIARSNIASIVREHVYGA